MWYERSRVGRGVFRLRETAVHPWFRANIYFVKGRDADLVIDTGMGLRPLLPELPATDGKPIIGFVTHIHADHVGALHEFAIRTGPRASAASFSSMPDALTLAYLFRQLDESVSTPPTAGWRAADYRIPPAPLTRMLGEGDRIDLGDRSFSVIALPGHSPDGIGLFDEADGTLFAGDAVYDDELLDSLPGSDRNAYRATMRRLRDNLDVSIVHGGHGESFGPDRLREIANAYMAEAGVA